MVRSAYSYGAEQPLDRMAERLRDSFKRRYPNLGAYDFDYVWSGSTALTGNGASFVGQVQPGACLGWLQRVGVVKGTIYGKLLGGMDRRPTRSHAGRSQGFRQAQRAAARTVLASWRAWPIALQTHKAGLER